MKMNIVIFTVKSWNLKNAEKLKNLLKYKMDVYVFSDKEQLRSDYIKNLNPRYVFFPHWSWKIPRDIYERYECIGFHITDLPFGRGGSPLQNLILRRIYKTKITAFRITEDIDAGPIYMKRDLCLELGSAEEILMEASKIIFFEMIPYIIENKPSPTPQEGKVVVFKRKTPKESNLLEADIKGIEDLYDFIRMLDAEGYPKAFIQLGKLRIEFSEVHKKSDKLVGRFEVFEEDEEGSDSSCSS